MSNYYILLYCLYAFGQAIFTERVLEENPSDRDAGAVGLDASELRRRRRRTN